MTCKGFYALFRMVDNENIRHTNAAAMHGGVVLGFFAVLTLVVLRWSFFIPFLSTLFVVMLAGSPVLATLLTLQYRREVAGAEQSFSFMSGFLYALFTGFYASLWVALVTFVYLQYFDHGTIFQAYAAQLNTPEAQTALQQSGMAAQLEALDGGRGAEGLAETLQSLGAATYAALSLYFSLIAGPVISVIIGLICKRK